jgi:hypothetical protein
LIPIKKIGADFYLTILRFPIPILTSLIAFGLFVFENHFIKSDSFWAKNFVLVKVILSCITSLSSFIAFDIYAEKNSISKPSRIGFLLLIFCVLGLHYNTITPAMFDNEQIFLSRYLIFVVIFHLMVSVSAYVKEKDLSRFWQFNQFLFIRFFTSIIFSLTLIIGLVSALWAIENLFGLDISGKYYTDIIFFVALIFNTLFFLMGIPSNFAIFSNSIEYKNALRIFVQYIMIPMIGIYFIILYFYLFKIVFLQKIPNGWVCVPILIFSFIGILAYLLIYPIRNDRSKPIIFKFARYFYFILLPLLSLYFIAIILRIKPYGITEDRYLVFILGIWILVISLYIIFSKRDNIIIIPTSLIVILFLSAIGPWGMFQFSIQNQILRLEKNLKRNHILSHNEILHDKTKIKLSENDAKSIQSILQFLYKRDELEMVRKWIPENELSNLKLAMDSNQLYKLYPVFGLKDIKDYNERFLIFINVNKTFSSHPINIQGYHFIQQFQLNQEDENKDLVSNVSIKLKRNSLQINHASNSAFISIDSIIHSILLPTIFTENPITISKDSIILYNGINKIFIESINVEKVDTVFDIKQINGYYLY